MENLVHSGEKRMLLLDSLWSKLASFHQRCCRLFSRYILIPISKLNPFWVQLHYFISLSILGYLALKVSKPRTTPFFMPKDLDLFFTSVSASTTSSMSTVEMEVFSNTQLVIMTILMFFGGEVFTSWLGLQLLRSNLKNGPENRSTSTNYDSESPDSEQYLHQNELSLFNHPRLEVENPKDSGLGRSEDLKSKSIKCLGYVVLCYLLVVHIGGSILVSLYIILVPSAREVLKHKGLHIPTFSVFTIVSTFSNCGFIPTNENMVVFIKNSGLLLLLIPQVLLGNTLYAPCLRFVIWVLGRLTKRKEFIYILKNCRQLGYDHLLCRMYTSCLVATVFGFVLIQFILFCAMEWNTQHMDGLNFYQKLVGSLFEVVNSRHAGESVFDISSLSSAILVMFIVMMYLPPHTSFIPIKDDEQIPQECGRKRKRRAKVVENLMFSQLSYLVIFVILICITERKSMKEDPLNFSVLNIVIEVISAYGNVGFTTGYSCARQLKPDGNCTDKWYGLSGKWSNEGKIVLIVVMFFGKLKTFSTGGGKAWTLL